MKTLRKTKKCLNCGQVLSEVYDYCPLCGQENTDNNVTFKELVGDFFSNYFSLDSKFFRSIKPFFIQPGALTNSFNEGKRKSYANPVRLYIIISFFYFFVLSFFASDLSESINSSTSDEVTLDSLRNEVKEELSTELNQPDSTVMETSTDSYEDTNSNFKISFNDWPLSDSEWDLFFATIDDETLSGQKIYDSLKVDYKPPFTRHVIRQMIRVYKTDKEYVFAFIIKNFSLMMFFMLPIFALILKLLYIRRKILFINHLVHTIHIHSFAFLIYGITLALILWVFDGDFIENIAFLIVTVYCYLSFKRVYKQSHKKTLVKFFLTGLLYSGVMLLAFLIELSISFLVF